MTINVNGNAMSVVNVNGTRMEVVNINDTEVYRAQNGNVTLVSANNSSFSPGAEDVNRHFVVLTSQFSGGGLPFPSVPSINGTATTQINADTSGAFDDGGTAGIYTIKIPTGTGTFTLSGGSGTPFTIYRVVGCASMNVGDAVSRQTNNGVTGPGNVASPANGKGCFFGVAVGNFSTPPGITPTSAGLDPGYTENACRHTASNVVTANTQFINLNGNQISSFVIFPYTLF